MDFENKGTPNLPFTDLSFADNDSSKSTSFDEETKQGILKDNINPSVKIIRNRSLYKVRFWQMFMQGVG